MSKPYNYIYEKLVQGPEDLTGLVAYGLYKREKIEFIERLRADGQEVSDEQIQDFHHASNTGTRLQSYRDQAEKLLHAVIVNVIEEQAGDIQEQYESELAKANANHARTVSDLATKLADSQKFWPGVWQNVVSSLIAAIVVALIVFAIIASKYGLADTIADWSGYQPKSTVNSAN